jgi:WxL interacting protein linking bacterial and host surfaces
MIRRALLIAVSGVLAAIVCAQASAATGQPVFALHPEHYDPSLPVTQSYFVVKAQPGDTITNSVRVVNTGTQPGTVLLYPVDATTGRTSGAVYLDGTKPRRDVGSWLTVGTRSLTLAAGKSAVVPVTLHVPATARPGDHLGGVVAENAAISQASGKGALRIRVRHLTIVGYEVQVPGPAVAAVDVTRVRAVGEGGYQFVDLHLANTGALTSKPTGTLVVTASNGKHVASETFKLDTFLPGTAIDYPVLLPKQALAPGQYKATVTLIYGAAAIGYRRTAGPTQTITRELPFTVSNAQYHAVFRGAPPLKAPQAATSNSGGGMSAALIAGIAAALLAFSVLLIVALRRWSVH